MHGIGTLKLAILLVLLFADSPFSLAKHMHQEYDETVNCAICSFAATAVVLTSQPVRLPLTGAPADRVETTSQQTPATCKRAANRTRAPPAHTS